LSASRAGLEEPALGKVQQRKTAQHRLFHGGAAYRNLGADLAQAAPAWKSRR